MLGQRCLGLSSYGQIPLTRTARLMVERTGADLQALFQGAQGKCDAALDAGQVLTVVGMQVAQNCSTCLL